MLFSKLVKCLSLKFNNSEILADKKIFKNCHLFLKITFLFFMFKWLTLSINNFFFDPLEQFDLIIFFSFLNNAVIWNFISLFFIFYVIKYTFFAMFKNSKISFNLVKCIKFVKSYFQMVSIITQNAKKNI